MPCIEEQQKKKKNQNIQETAVLLFEIGDVDRNQKNCFLYHTRVFATPT
jgi:hypothetical protein